MNDACPDYLDPNVIYATSMARKGHLKVKIFRPMDVAKMKKKPKNVFIAIVPLVKEGGGFHTEDVVIKNAETVTEAFQNFLSSANDFIKQVNEDVDKIGVYNANDVRKITDESQRK